MKVNINGIWRGEASSEGTKGIKNILTFGTATQFRSSGVLNISDTISGISVGDIIVVFGLTSNYGVRGIHSYIVTQDLMTNKKIQINTADYDTYEYYMMYVVFKK